MVLDRETAKFKEARFPSMAAMQARHAELLHKLSPRASGSGDPEAILQFLRAGAATGAVLDSADERSQAQGMLDYWVTTLDSLSRKAKQSGETVGSYQVGFEQMILAPFDSKSMADQTASADRWISQLDPSEQALVRRILLCLCRLRPNGNKVESVPTPRASLYDIASQEKLNGVINKLTDCGVVRVVPGPTSDAELIALRSPTLLESWVTLSEWVKQRRQFRENVIAWNAASQPKDKLVADDALDEARTYHDRNDLEREFTDASRYWERREAETSRWQKHIFLLTTIVIGLLSVATITGWWRALQESRVANRKSVALEARQSLSAMSGVARALAQMGAGDEPARLIASWRLDQLQLNATNDPKVNELLRKHSDVLARMRENKATPSDLRTLQLAALNFGRGLKNDVLAGGSPDLIQRLTEDRRVTFDVVRRCAGRIVSGFRSDTFQETIGYVNEFRILYWGDMTLVEGDIVSKAMVQFNQAIQNIERSIDQSKPNELRSIAQKDLSPRMMSQMQIKRPDDKSLNQAITDYQKKRVTNQDLLRELEDRYKELKIALEKELEGPISLNPLSEL